MFSPHSLCSHCLPKMFLSLSIQIILPRIFNKKLPKKTGQGPISTRLQVAQGKSQLNLLCDKSHELAIFRGWTLTDYEAERKKLSLSEVNLLERIVFITKNVQNLEYKECITSLCASFLIYKQGVPYSRLACLLLRTVD